MIFRKDIEDKDKTILRLHEKDKAGSANSYFIQCLSSYSAYLLYFAERYRVAGIFILFLMMSITSCEEATDWELTPGDNGRLVVEAILTDEQKVQTLRLSTSYDGLNEETPKVTDAEVWVEVNGITVRFLPDSIDAGLYKSEVPFTVLNNLEYQLQVDWQGTRYTATSTLSSVAPIPEITFQRVGNSNDLTFDKGPFLYNANQQAMYEMNIDWSNLSSDSLTRAKIVFYTFNTIDESELIRPDQETVTFPRGSIVVLRKFGLNDDFADYLRATAIELEWNGGALYSAPSSLPTNISNGGLGFFSTCAVKQSVFIAL